jgi:uncharacterized integral membrane protein (TIGR00697 family)
MLPKLESSKPKQSLIFEVLVALFITTLIISNILSVRIVKISFLTFDGGTILFPLAYIISDIITEIYGFKKMRQLIYIGISMLGVMAVCFYIAQYLPADTQNLVNEQAYLSVLGVAWRIVLASMTALFIGDFINSYVLAYLKIRTKGKAMWLRVVSSTALGSLIDTTLFTVIAFVGTLSGNELLKISATVYFIKIATEVIISPVTIRIINYIKMRDHIDTYEKPHLKFYG